MGLLLNQYIISLQIYRSHGAFKEFHISIGQVEKILAGLDTLFLVLL